MNIQLQACGFLMLLLLLIFYKSHKTLNLYSERVFYRTLSITSLTVLFDMLSVAGIYFAASLPLLLVKIICKIYLSYLIWSAWATLTYILLVFSDLSVQRRITHSLGIVSFISNIILFVQPLDIFHEGRVIYTYGAAVTTTYVLCGVFILSALVLSFILWYKFRSRRAAGGMMLCLIWIGAAAVQFFNNEWLLVGFSQSLGMLILFVLMENPESYIDEEYGTFNMFGLKPYIDMLFQTESEFHVAQAFIENDAALPALGHDVNEMIRAFIKSGSQRPGVKVFKDTGYNMIIVSQSLEDHEAALKAVADTKGSRDYLRGHAKLVSLEHAEKLLTYADIMDILAYTKGSCVNRTTEYVEIDDSIIKRNKERSDVSREIDDALAEDRVEVFLQPIFSNKDKSFTSAEALTRIRLKDGRLLSPGIFIPVAEKTGQIILLGYRILDKVLQFISSNDMEALGIHYVEVNLSVMQCEQVDLFDQIMAMVEKYSVDTRYINFEITESATISTKEIINANIQKLFEAGFSLSLDDFGKGESNLMYVVDMPVSLMKFDIDMSKAYFDSYKAKSIMRAIIPMAHGLDLKLVSEGVETARELELLSSEGVDYIQGYYFAKPLPMKDFLEFVKKRNCPTGE